MKIRYRAYGAYHQQYHVVWSPKSREKVLKGEVMDKLREAWPEVRIIVPGDSGFCRDEIMS